MVQITDKLIGAITGLLIPVNRFKALQTLVEFGILSEDDAKRFSDRLMKGAYDHRAMARKLVPVLVAIQDFLDGHAFSSVAPAKWRRQLDMWDHAARGALGFSIFDAAYLKGRSILDFGSGRTNPLGFSIILYSNGARRVVSLEPGQIDVEAEKYAVQQVVRCLMTQTATLNVSGRPDQKLRRRLASLDLCLPVSGSETRSVVPIQDGISLKTTIADVDGDSIDIVLSGSVLEHVESMEREFSELFRISRPGGIGIHIVDFSHHKKSDNPYDPFAFYYEDVGGGINELRVNDVVDLLRNAQYSVEIVNVNRLSSYNIDRSRLREKFKAYSDEDLCVSQASFVVTKPVAKRFPDLSEPRTDPSKEVIQGRR